MKESTGGKVFDTFNLFLFSVFCLTIIYPIYQLAVNSISTEASILSSDFRFFPSELYFGNWEKIMSAKLIWQSFFNSVLVTVCGSAYSLFLSATYAYPLSRRNLPDRNFWTFILVFTMFFSGGLIPYYLLMRDLGLVNTRLVMIVGGINAWNTLIMRNYFMTVPDSLLDSAKVDGANEITILWKVVLPLSIPVIATVLLWNLVGNWNSWISCMIYISDAKKQVLQIVLRDIYKRSNYNLLSQNPYEDLSKLSQKSISNEGLKAATWVFVTFPILVTYPFLQKYFVKGIMIGSLKG